jgi:hypothetical protein
LLVSRGGQVGAWVTLPHDSLGPIFDLDDAGARMAALIETLLALDVPQPERVAFAVAIEPASMLMLGRAAEVGRRSSASLPMTGLTAVRVEPDDDLPSPNVGDVTGIAEELVARLEARCRALGFNRHDGE